MTVDGLGHASHETDSQRSRNRNHLISSMEGLKLIAQSTFDRHQKFRPGPAGPGTSGEGAPYRYNVIEIGAFAGTAPTSSSTVSKRQSCSGASASSSRQNGSSTGSPSRVSLNEWMVHEDDLGAFMKKRPVHVSSNPAPAQEQQQQQQSQDAQDTGTATNSSTGLSRSASLPSSRMTRSGTSNTTATAATSGSTASAPARRNIGSSGREEVEAVASLKLVCIQRAADLDSDDYDASADPNSNALAISRETFLRLYVDNMDADHCALYYLAREYDGFLEFNDSSKSIATKFIGTSDYALIWTFNRRTLETKGLFIDRCHRWQAKDTTATPAPAAHSIGGSVPVTPVRKIGPGDSSSVHSTPSRKWTQNKSGTVTASAAWHVFRDTLNMYRTYVFAPQLLSFVCCVHMLRTFDDQVNGDDLPLIKDAETSITAAHEAALLQGAAATADDDDDQQMNAHQRRGLGVGGSLLPTQTTGSFVIAPEHNPFAPSTPPSEAEKMIHSTAAPPAATAASAHRAAAAERHRLLSHALAGSRVDTSLSNKLRHLQTTRTVLESIAREHETVVVDVVASEFLDRYHRSMEGMTEAVPALERHVSSLEEYLRYLKGRSERLSGTLVVARAAAEQQQQQQQQLQQPQKQQQRRGAPTAVGPRDWEYLLRSLRSGRGARVLDLAAGTARSGTGSGDQADEASAERLTVAVVALASTPAIFSAGIIAIVSLRWSVIVPCLVLVFYGWVTVTQREFLVEFLGEDGQSAARRHALEFEDRADETKPKAVSM